ncbi:penicillin acylase family protein [Pseudoruegeria sp. SK021]|uniref:penicillin acylase family protein n=1 Tax=Pseudoruegeria sp. SK021 TaxID=1933035 RepID=UPI000A21AE75|nr:penicillin acylase family protein [Pseudoruegeria sp. SK021]OSP55263.1 penicillin acylase family protein [Pseudoruegeria sp. SK021]
MILAFRWLLRLVLAALCVGSLLAALAFYLASRSLPDYSATFELDGISAPVKIVRDTANVPHIFGQTDADSYFGLGFVHAQDRLWQMTMLRRTVQGRLSELFGARTVGIDEMMRRFDLYRLAASSVSVQTPEAQQALDAYAAGVNAWIDQVNAGARGRGAPELFLFQPDIAPWQPADSLAMIKLMALKLDGQLQDEVLRARVALALDPERVLDLLPDVPGEGIAVLPDLTWLRQSPDATQHADGRDVRDDPLSPVKKRGFESASNVWAAAPHRTTTGGTLLANDPHLGLSAPSIWYLARLELSTGGVIGGTIPGMPPVLVGRNNDLAWGLTSTGADDLDVYVEQVNPENPDEYLSTSGDFMPFRSEGSVVRIKDHAPRTLTLRWTERGPVLPPSSFDLGRITPPGYITSVAWTALSGEDTSMSAALDLMQARSIDQAIEAASQMVSPAQNLILVDRTQIAMQVVGALPRRSPLHDSLGRLPTPGWRPENNWQGTFAYDSNPRFLDPEGGILGNTNNKVIDRPFPMHVSYNWGDSQRVYRWRKLMQDRKVHSRESFIEAQLDTVSVSARALLPLIGADLWFTSAAAAPDTLDARRRDALALLADWNGEMNEHLPEPLIYAAWVRALQARLISDELGGELASEFTHVDPLFIERVYRDIDGAGVWCNVLQSNAIETCAEISRLALDDALVWLEETYGGSVESLQWGDAHVAMHDHEVLGSIPVLNWMVNIRQSTSGGDNTLDRGLTSGTGPNPFQNVHAAGYRGVYDMADPDSSVFVISTGQSGHPLSRFYDNLGDRWRRGEYIPMSLDPELAEAAATGITLLEPATD